MGLGKSSAGIRPSRKCNIFVSAYSTMVHLTWRKIQSDSVLAEKKNCLQYCIYAMDLKKVDRYWTPTKKNDYISGQYTATHNSVVVYGEYDGPLHSCKPM